MIVRSIQDYSSGETASFAKTIAESDVYGFAGLTGDFNPAHVDEEYARQTPFQGRIAHGLFAAGLISTVLGMRLPGPGTIYLSQELKFLKPVKIGDTVTAHVEIREVIAAKHRLRLRTWCTNQAGDIVLEGEALVMPPRP